MDPYSAGLFNQIPFEIKRALATTVVAILKVKADKRGLNLICPMSRALKKNEIHELIVTNEKEAAPGKIVNQVAYIAFIEMKTGGVMVVGDEVYWNNSLLGIVVGFDDTHMPNHQNIVLYSPKILTGKELNIQIEDRILIYSKN